MKEFFTDTLELDKFLKYDLLIQNDHNLKEPIRIIQRMKRWKSSFLENGIKYKDSKNFSSLERIRIVVDSLIGDKSIEEICHKEKISQNTFYEWKRDFLVAFNRHSEDILIQEKLITDTKDIILRETNVEVYNFFKKFIDVYSGKNLIIPKGERFSTYSSFSFIRNVVILNKLNDFRQINIHLEEVNSKLEINGVLAGCFETFNARAKKKKIL